MLVIVPQEYSSVDMMIGKKKKKRFISEELQRDSGNFQKRQFLAMVILQQQRKMCNKASEMGDGIHTILGMSDEYSSK
jgi:hypothetical protein